MSLTREQILEKLHKKEDLELQHLNEQKELLLQAVREGNTDKVNIFFNQQEADLITRLLKERALALSMVSYRDGAGKELKEAIGGAKEYLKHVDKEHPIGLQSAEDVVPVNRQTLNAFHLSAESKAMETQPVEDSEQILERKIREIQQKYTGDMVIKGLNDLRRGINNNKVQHLKNMAWLEQDKATLTIAFEEHDHVKLQAFFREREQRVQDSKDGMFKVLIQGLEKREALFAKAVEEERKYKEERKALQEKYEEEKKARELESELRVKEMKDFRDKFHETSVRAKETFGEMIKECEVREQTILVNLKNKGVNIDVEEDNVYLDILYEYLQKGNPMPDEGCLKVFKIQMEPKISPLLFLDPFFLYVIRTTCEESIMRSWEDGVDDVDWEKLLIVPNSIIDIAKGLSTIVPEEDGSIKCVDTHDETLQYEMTAEQISRFNDLMLEVVVIRDRLVKKLEEAKEMEEKE